MLARCAPTKIYSLTLYDFVRCPTVQCVSFQLGSYPIYTSSVICEMIQSELIPDEPELFVETTANIVPLSYSLLLRAVLFRQVTDFS